MTAGFNIALPGTEPAPGTYTRDNHPLRNVKPDRATVERMFAISREVAENIARIFPDPIDLTREEQVR